ncbi:glutamyl-tRNA(Gln) amidotransferase subunit C, mitochondrial [Bactrocera neohumeralis]|uniref:glutamyl-tRNA(Gln) amidotransferase subunit C, mitochondrial n=1 Tax=Bactrocera tryoni TaxID=59916 RepID=UPI001A964605|nr:glutamyl-tRNA(Gln) amidotransferase subunit C, mitochondrial [Bactrocera tryoni]XP_050319628.1 glutamyl-tRNA(Gln) amidotransferase subunit C, mitochondrial [Bactrocera neohumeralis]
MQRILQKTRSYCTVLKEVNKNQKFDKPKENKLNFKELKYPSKVPSKPIKQNFPTGEKPVIDNATIQLLERLALVNLESKEALTTLEKSIEFAEKISHIDTSNVLPLYTVLEDQNLYLREDSVTEGNCREDILRSAKVTEEDYFVSPPGNIPLQQKEKDFTDN